MLSKLKRFVMKHVALYHQKMGDYYFRKVDEYGPDNNEHWMDKVVYHTKKEFDIYAKVLGMENI